MQEKSRNYSLFFIVLFLMFLVVFIFYLDWQGSHKKLTFAMLDIGQGDAIYIESPTGTQILFDTGPRGAIMREIPKVMPILDRSIDAVVITNPDSDHMAGFLDVLKIYKVGVVFEPGTNNDSSTYKNLQNEIDGKKIPHLYAKKGVKLDLGGGAVIEILFPDRDVSSWERNDGSVIAKLTYGENTFILTGDATSKTEKLVLENNSKEFLDVDFLKVGHHGSRTSTSYDFVKALTPQYALISDGKGNSYGHPHEEVLDLLSKFNAKVLRTDILGTIIFKCDIIGECKIRK